MPKYFFSPNHTQNKIQRFLKGFQEQTLLYEQTITQTLIPCNHLSSLEHYAWKLIILLLFLFVVAMIVVWWHMESIPPLPYDLLELSHALLEHTLVFHRKKNLGLFKVQAPIQVLAYGVPRRII